MSKIEKYIKTIPKVFKPGNNPVMNALLNALAEADDNVTTSIADTKEQLFIRTAQGKYLDKLSNSLGVSRPVDIGLSDTQFQELIPNLSLKHKQIRKTLYDTCDIFWGVLFSRSNVTSSNTAPFVVSDGDEIKIKVDGGATQKLKALTGDIASAGNATSTEIATIINRGDGLVASIITDPVTSLDSINIRTNTPGSTGSIEIVDSSMVSTSKLNLVVKKHELNQLPQRVSIYEINPNEIIIELPASLSAVRRDLIGSHHFHSDSTIDTDWPGSFLYNDSSDGQFTVSNEETHIDENLLKGQVYTKVTVDDASVISATSGFLIFGWGSANEESGIKFRGVPNSKTVLIDPSYVFQKNHSINEKVNVLSSNIEFSPNVDGRDYPIYLTSPVNARSTVESLLRTLTAAGIIVTFRILSPSFKYLIDDPYSPDDDAPGTN